MTTLAHDEILKLHQAALVAGLAASRDALLGGIGENFVRTLRLTEAPAEQLLSDLHTLNATGELADGSVPLLLWLANAQAITFTRVESSVFERSLRRARGEHSSGTAKK